MPEALGSEVSFNYGLVDAAEVSLLDPPSKGLMSNNFALDSEPGAGSDIQAPPGHMPSPNFGANGGSAHGSPQLNTMNGGLTDSGGKPQRARVPQGGILNCAEIAFPKEFIGCLIGEKGDRIREIRERLTVNFITDKQEIGLGMGNGSGQAFYRNCKCEGDWDNMWDCICECVTNITTRFDAIAGNKQAAVFDIMQMLNCHVKVPGAVAGVIVGKQGANFKEVIRQVGELDGNSNSIILRAKEDPGDPTIRWIHCAAMHDKIVPLLMSLANLIKGAYMERDIGLTNYRSNANNGIKGNGFTGKGAGMGSPQMSPGMMPMMNGMGGMPNMNMNGMGGRGGMNGGMKRNTSGAMGGMGGMMNGNDGENFLKKQKSMSFNNNQQQQGGWGGNNGSNQSSPQQSPSTPPTARVLQKHLQTVVQNLQKDQGYYILGEESTKNMIVNTAVLVPAPHIGKVIGPKGAIINAIRDYAGVRIETDQKPDGPAGNDPELKRVLTIEGSMLGVMLAQTFVYKALSMENSNQLLEQIVASGN